MSRIFNDYGRRNDCIGGVASGLGGRLLCCPADRSGVLIVLIVNRPGGEQPGERLGGLVHQWPEAALGVWLRPVAGNGDRYRSGEVPVLEIGCRKAGSVRDVLADAHRIAAFPSALQVLAQRLPLRGGQCEAVQRGVTELREHGLAGGAAVERQGAANRQYVTDGTLALGRVNNRQLTARVGGEVRSLLGPLDQPFQ